ncbi:flagellin [Pseudalkalibacillus sp. SCS-8]|uniref:flagellin n=1 Tax=Pseudalkalibacillus nanhaiensis TaxID=3115291 RepID=UPI0032DA67E8
MMNHTISALHTVNTMRKNVEKSTYAMEKLGSGIRITKAREDSAGLAISEKMRAQIRGLQQAQRNIQDGISLLQLADSGLEKIQNPFLQRMRELAIQASNDTLSGFDRQQIQVEVDQIKEGIDETAHQTEFNKIKLLRTPIIKTPPKITGGKTDIVFIIDDTGSMGSAINNVKNNITDFVDGIASKGIDVQLGLVTYGDVSPSENGNGIAKKEFVSDVNTFKTYLSDIRVVGGGDWEESGLEGIKDTSSGALSYSFREGASIQFVMVTDAPVHDNAIDGDGGDGQSIYDIDQVADELKSKNIKLHVVGNDNKSSTNNPYTQLQRLTEPTNGTFMDINGSFSEQLSSLATTIVSDAGTTTEGSEMPTLKFQVGANSNNTFSVQLFDSRTSALGIENVNLTNQSLIRTSLTQIDNALEIVAAARGKFGVYQNALEHILENVSNSELNLVASESMIRDVDMAKEVLEVTKNDMVNEASKTILTQINQNSKQVLDLLKSY